ncbi:MAG: HEAT repeat domain-containing protein [Planctomycetota bacterium]|nr:HEAT repeat domain-containing protein [Planctomycetota bacterium]
MRSLIRISSASALALAIILLPGCGPRAHEGGMHSDNPAAKLYAIRHAGEARDARAVPDLVEQLDSDDPAVRMLSIHALEQIAGTRMGYNPYASAQERKPAVEAWTQAAKSGRYPTTAQPVSSTRPGQ